MGREFRLLPVAVSSVCAFAAGAVASWYTFGAPRGVDLVADSGSTADWVAAISTGVVGLGACWFAYEANRHRRNEVARQEARERAARNARLAQLLDVAVTYMCVEDAVKGFKDPQTTDRSIDNVKLALEVNAKLRARHNWASIDISILDDATVADLSRLQALQIQFDDLAQDFRAAYSEHPSAFDPDKCSALQNLVDTVPA